MIIIEWIFNPSLKQLLRWILTPDKRREVLAIDRAGASS
jgi:hypothetical protein